MTILKKIKIKETGSLDINISSKTTVIKIAWGFLHEETDRAMKQKKVSRNRPKWIKKLNT